MHKANFSYCQKPNYIQSNNIYTFFRFSLFIFLSNLFLKHKSELNRKEETNGIKISFIKIGMTKKKKLMSNICFLKKGKT